MTARGPLMNTLRPNHHGQKNTFHGEHTKYYGIERRFAERYSNKMKRHLRLVLEALGWMPNRFPQIFLSLFLHSKGITDLVRRWWHIEF